VQLFGVQIGIVTDVKLVPDRRATSSPALVRVAFDIQPERVGATPSAFAPDGLRPLVARGLRVLLDSASLLTGQKVLSLQYIPGAKDGRIEEEGDDVVLPSQAAGMDSVMLALSDITAKMDQIPFADIGNNLNGALRSVQQTVGGPDMHRAIQSLAATLGDAQHLVHEANGDLTPAMQKLPALADQMQQAIQTLNDALGEGGYGKNSDFQRSMTRLLDQAGGAARTIRLLADFLDRHPEALLRGRASAQGEGH
jgi:paraquat-inducible protein B